MLAALVRDDLCLLQTQINVRIESRRRPWTGAAEQIEWLPSNDGREWVVRLEPISSYDDLPPDEIDIELLTMLTTILREASLLPEADFSARLERAFESGLRHKLSPGRPHDQLAAAFAADTEAEIRGTANSATPWDCREGSSKAHQELSWQDGLGPTYSRDRAKELLHTRYLNLAKSLRLTVVMLGSSEHFRPTADSLRSKGWLDWHILTAIFNIAMNYRFPEDGFNPPSKATQSEMIQAGFRAESATRRAGSHWRIHARCNEPP